MNKLKQKILGKNVMKSIILLIVVILCCTITALIHGFLPGVSKIPLIVILSIEILLIIKLLFDLSKLFRSIIAISQNAELLAQNELNIDDVRYEDALGVEILAMAFNDMKANLLSFIDLTKANIITISDAIENVSKSMDNSYTGNEQIAANMGNVAEKAQEQSKLMDDTMSRIDEVKNRIENITNSIEEVEKSVEQTVHATNVGVQNLDTYYHQVNIISDNLNSTSEYIKRLNSDITQIDKIGKFVIKISEQLKLLGLNASVEAGKAGESGKGFSVVAREMNLLSAATKKSIGEINTILKNIGTSSEVVRDSIDSCIKSYSDSKNIFISIKESFDIINNSASLLEVDMKKVYSDVYSINSSTQEINQKSLLLHNVSGEISNKTQEVAAVTQESLAELEGINNYTSTLKGMLTGIEKLVKKFHTSVIPVEADSKTQLNIAFISPLDNDFWYLLQQGVVYAQKELADRNVLIDYIAIKEDVGPQIINSVRKAIENNVSGIIVPGFNPEIVELIEVAHNKNIPVMTYNFDLQEKSKRVAYCGPEFYEIGYMTVRLIVKILRGKGDIAIFFGKLDTSVKKVSREITFAELKKFKGIKVVAESLDADNIEDSYNTAKNLLSQNHKIQGIIVRGIGSLGVAKAIEELGYSGKIPIITFNFSQEIAEYIKKGIIHSTIIHDPFSQGHDPIIHFYNMLVTGQKPESENIGTRFEVINQNNVHDYD